jgi:DNA-binding NarL/FixJ family response regulator
MRGERFLSPQITGVVVEDYVRTAPEGSAYVLLRPRERAVLQLVAEGKTSAEMAARLHISPKTVETHRRNIMQKLGLHSVAELTKYAIREGLTSVDR